MATGASSRILTVRKKSTFAPMQAALSKYAKANDRRMVLRSMREVKDLANIEMEGVYLAEANIGALEEEISEEASIILNEIPFTGSKHFLTTIKELCFKLCETEGVEMSSEQLYEALVTRLGRTTSSTDAQILLNTLIGSPDLVFMPTKHAKKQSFPIKLNLYVSAGEVHAVVQVISNIGIFRKSDIKPADIKRGVVATRAWIPIEACVDERVNLSANRAARILRVKLPETLY